VDVYPGERIRVTSKVVVVVIVVTEVSIQGEAIQVSGATEQVLERAHGE